MTKLNSTWSTLWNVDRVALAPYTLATKSKGRSAFGWQSRPSWRRCRPWQAVKFKLLFICRQNRRQKSTVSATRSTVLATVYFVAGALWHLPKNAPYINPLTFLLTCFVAGFSISRFCCQCVPGSMLIIFICPPGQTGRQRRYILTLSVCPSVRLFVHPFIRPLQNLWTWKRVNRFWWKLEQVVHGSRAWNSQL